MANAERGSLRAHLHHLSILSRNPDGLAGFYERALGLRFEPVGAALVGVASQRFLVIERGPDRSLGYAAYEVESPEYLASLSSRLGQAGCTILPSPTALFGAGSICTCDPDGNKLVFGTAASGGPTNEATSSATPPARLQHFVVASRDCAKLSDFYRDVLGFKLSDTVLDGDGAVKTCFLRCSDEHHDFAVFQAAENRLDHHCYEAGDWNAIRDWADHFAKCRIPTQWGPGRHGPGNNLFVFIHDADGNWIELSAELERVCADRAPGSWPHEERTLNLWGQAPLRS